MTTQPETPTGQVAAVPHQNPVVLTPVSATKNALRECLGLAGMLACTALIAAGCYYVYVNWGGERPSDRSHGGLLASAHGGATDEDKGSNGEREADKSGRGGERDVNLPPGKHGRPPASSDDAPLESDEGPNVNGKPGGDEQDLNPPGPGYPGQNDPDKDAQESTDPDNAEPGNAEPGNAEPGNAEPGNAEPDGTTQDSVNRVLIFLILRVVLNRIR